MHVTALGGLQADPGRPGVSVPAAANDHVFEKQMLRDRICFIPRGEQVFGTISQAEVHEP
jgi:hypothetical protein